MLRILKTEWMKIRSYTAFWILSGLFVVGVIGLNYSVWAIRQSVDVKAGKANAETVLGSPFAYPDVWNTTAWLSGWVLFIPGLIIIMIMTNEFTYRTNRQNVIDGWTRKQFIDAKLLWVVLLSVVAAVSCFISALIFGGIGDVPFTADKMVYVLYFFLESFTYLMAALLFGVLLRRSGLAIGLFFLYTMLLKNIISGLLNHFLPGQIGSYFPLKSSDELIPFPFIKNLTKGAIAAPPPLAALLSVSIVYVGIFYGWMLYKFRNDNL